MKYRLVWEREGRYYYNSNIGAWRIELHKSRKLWTAKILFQKQIVKKLIMGYEAEIEDVKEWAYKEFDYFLGESACDNYLNIED